MSHFKAAARRTDARGDASGISSEIFVQSAEGYADRLGGDPRRYECRIREKLFSCGGPRRFDRQCSQTSASFRFVGLYPVVD
jgi:hypothetical protein